MKGREEIREGERMEEIWGKRETTKGTKGFRDGWREGGGGS